ncbi:glycosyltransferase family 2 protein [Flavobacterium sp. RSB2_4_14]|uniref:glycosyltransferase family 2 protein n=1 Tax=Flavobacterium sp. RSB2_4_14 TaxID=3447665 RepID=UPI003F3C177C
MQLSVIILNYNVRYFLELCVMSVQKAIQNMDAEIIVVDNNSSDDSCAMMNRCFPDVKLIQNNENLGFPKGNNIGVAQAKGEYICILNPDTVVAEDTFEKVLAFSKSKTDLGIVGCKLIDGTGNFLPESKRGIPTPWVAFTKIFGLYKLFPSRSVGTSLFTKYYAQHLTQNQTGKVDILVGAFMVMKRELYTEIGGFDENCFMYSDDIDLSYMVLQKGKNNYYFHETTIIHYKGESTVRDGTYMKRFQEAMNFFYKKHFNPSFFFTFFMKIGSFIFSLFKKSQQKNKAISVDETILFSKEITNLPNFEKISNYTNLEEFNENPNHSCQLIFDINSFSFIEIIDAMQILKAKNITFKMYLAQNNYVIGSNSANDIGEIINLSKIA